jgi:hypothetical protein
MFGDGDGHEIRDGDGHEIMRFLLRVGVGPRQPTVITTITFKITPFYGLRLSVLISKMAI